MSSREETLTALREERVDLVSYLYATHVEEPEREGLQVVTSGTPSTSFLGFNLSLAPYGDARVRQAIRAGLDIEGMVRRFHPGARIARTLTPPELLDEMGLMPEPTLDIALAERLLREAGLRRVQLTLSQTAGRDTSEEDEVLFRPLVEAGLVELRHETLSSEEFAQRRREGRLPAVRVGWIADYPDPDNFLHFLLNSKAQTVYPLHYRGEGLDKLTAEARATIDPEHRKQLYRLAEKHVHQDCPLIPLFHHRVYAAASPRVQGLRLHQALPQVRFEDLWLDKEEEQEKKRAG
jgi:ABC-type oligopeptide transport system substrate-binding subunit